MLSLHRSIFLAFSLLFVLGCAESNREEASGKVDIRAINAIVGAPNVNFFIEERNLDSAAFKSSIAVQRFDDLSYNFSFELLLPGETSQRVLATQFVDVAINNDYVFVLDGTVQNPQMLLWETEERQWDGTETVFELDFAHLNDTLGAVDVYFAATGTPPSPGNETATLDNGDRTGALEFASGDYELILTPPDDPQTVLYTSGERSYDAATTDLVIIFDKDPSVTGDINLRHISNAGVNAEMPDPRFPPQSRFVHAAFGTGNIDIAQDDNFNPPLVTNLAFGEQTPDVDVAVANTDYTYTDTGNMGAVLAEATLTNTAGQHFNRILVGAPGDLSVLNLPSVRRPFTTNPRIAISHAASSFDNLDVYLLPAGDSIADNNPTSPNIPFQFASGLLSVVADDYELTLTLPGEETVVAGPVAIDLAAGDVVEALFLDTTDPNLADITLISYAP